MSEDSNEDKIYHLLLVYFKYYKYKEEDIEDINILLKKTEKTIFYFIEMYLKSEERLAIFLKMMDYVIKTKLDPKDENIFNIINQICYHNYEIELKYLFDLNLKIDENYYESMFDNNDLENFTMDEDDKNDIEMEKFIIYIEKFIYLGFVPRSMFINAYENLYDFYVRDCLMYYLAKNHHVSDFKNHTLISSLVKDLNKIRESTIKSKLLEKNVPDDILSLIMDYTY